MCHTLHGRIVCPSPLGSREAEIKVPCLAQVKAFVEREASGGCAAVRDATSGANSVQTGLLFGISTHLDRL